MRKLRKKTIVLAIAATCGYSAVAQAQNVTFYGRFYPQMNHYKVTGGTTAGTPVSTLTGTLPATATTGSGHHMESGGSRLGLRGSEKIGGNTTAFFQLEQGVKVEDGTRGTATVEWNRNTFLGLRGDYGQIRAGRIDTIYKQTTDTLGFMGIHSGNIVSASNILAARGFGSNNAHRFHERPANTIDYFSPKWAGFQFALGHSLGETASPRRTINSAAVMYSEGSWYAAVAHEQHNNLYGGSRNVPSARRNLAPGSATGAAFVPADGTSSKDTSTRGTVQYKISNATRVEFSYAVTKLSEQGGAVGRFQEYKHNNWYLGSDHRTGPWTFAAGYGQASAGTCSLVGGVACSTEGLEGNMLSLGTSYSLSKRTALYALTNFLQNGKSANYKSVSNAPNPGIGQDMRQIAIGIRHDF